MENQEIVTEVKASEGLITYLKDKTSEKTALELATLFSNQYERAKEWESKARKLIITSSLQVQEMKDAKVARLALVKIRTGIDKKRKELNEDDKSRIETRNDLAKYLTGLIEPTEQYLKEQEEFGEREIQKQNELIKNSRLEKLAPYEVETGYMDLINMPEEMFEKLLSDSKLSFELKEEKQKQLEALQKIQEKVNENIKQIISIGFYSVSENNDCFKHNDVDFEITLTELSMGGFESFFAGIKRDIEFIKTEKAAKKKAEDEALAKENARLQAEKDELERAEKEVKDKHNETLRRQQLVTALGILADYNALSQMDNQVFEDFYKLKKSEYDAEQNRIFIEKKKAEFEAEKARKEAEEKLIKEKEALLAPDKQKLLSIIDELVLKSNNYSTNEAVKIETDIFNKFEAFKKWANEQINTLK